MNIKKIFRSRLALVAQMYRPFKWAFFYLTLCIGLSQILSLTMPYLYGKIIDGFIKAKPVQQLVVFVLLMACVLVIRSLIELIHGYIHIRLIAYDVEERMGDITLGTILKFSLGQILNHNSGFKVRTIEKGEAALVNAMETLYNDIIPSLCKLVIIITSLFVLNWYFGVITLVNVCAFFTVSIIINNKMLPGLRSLRKTESKMSLLYWEIIKYLRLVIVHSHEERTIEEYDEKWRLHSANGKDFWCSYFNKITFLREPISIIGQCSILLAGIYLVSKGTVTPGRLVMAMSWSMTAFGAIGNIGSLQRRFTRDLILIERYFQLLEITPAVQVVSNPIRPEKFMGRIEFKNVSFKYPKSFGKDQWDEFGEEETGKNKDNSEGDERSCAIEKVSFVIEAGTTCALVGPSGAGKSTIINLLLRGYDPDEGQILIDGHDLRLLDLSAWRKAIGAVEQEPKLWDNTLAYNMVYGMNGHASSVTEESLHQLAQMTRIDEFYDRLGPSRFQTKIGENGVQLSGGQRQRVAIARAIARKPVVLIFDEATNALDPLNERLLQGAIKEALHGRTGIIIAHRLSTIRAADQIIVFEKGTVVGIGKHQKLIQTSTMYQDLVRMEVGSLQLV